MDKEPPEIASATIDLLEARLRRIEYVVHGRQPEDPRPDHSKPAIQRLKELEGVLDHLTRKSKVVQDLTRVFSRYPDFFCAANEHDAPSLLESSSKASIVLSAASSYPLAASSLTSILDTPIPPTSSSSILIDTKPTVDKAAALQQVHSEEINSLKRRSASLLQRWYAIDILQTGEWWADIEDRMENIDRVIRRSISGLPD